MHYFLRFAQPTVFYWLIPLFLLVLIYRFFLYSAPRYRYSMASFIKKSGFSYSATYKKVFFTIRLVSLIGLILLIAKPQLVDTRSRITVEGIDILLVLDISGSMQYLDHSDDNRSRLAIAQEEAIRFIEKRIDDQIGLVIFAKDALSRVPLTLDKKLLKQVVQDLKIGIIDPDGTMLSTAIVTAANRLRHAKAKSKIMILLTDGAPSEGDLSPSIAIELAKKLGIKIYTIGIGSEEGSFFMHPFYGYIQTPKINKELLNKIARETGGQSFMAHNAIDMRAIYDTINSLEKTTYETPVFNKYYDIFMPVVIGLILLLILELLFSTFIWFGI
jgi:Ca-activated chloride channel family protein